MGEAGKGKMVMEKKKNTKEKKKPQLKVYNSMTRKVEVFKPNFPGQVSMYVCGVTAYDLSHIGHARAAVSFDILFRYLKHLGYEVTYVRNFTDVDDKIIRRANELGEDPGSLSRRFCDEYLIDMASLQCLDPTSQPRVTDHMEQIKDLIMQIINNGFAYVVEGDVFYSVEQFPNYGQLSGQRLENMRAGERVAVDPRKHHPADFALWKSAKPGEPSWDSPWGPGRPGWHIECSAMSAHYLTFKFDIHGGGLDLIFPHHENEIAQSCAACEGSNVSYWMHNGHVTNNNEKMSKSLGNFFTIRQITERYHPLALRHFLMSAPYRSSLNYSVLQLETASEAVFYIYQTLLDCEKQLAKFEGVLKDNDRKTVKKLGVAAKAQKSVDKLHDEFEVRMSDDLDTPTLLTGAFQEALRAINGCLGALKNEQNLHQLALVLVLTELEEEVKLVMGVLGLLADCSYSQLLEQLKGKALIRAGLDGKVVQSLIEERKVARNSKNYQKSDQIRAELAVKGISLMDDVNEMTWRPCIPVEPKEQVLAPSTVIDQMPETVAGVTVEQKEAPAPSIVKNQTQLPVPLAEQKVAPSVVKDQRAASATS